MKILEARYGIQRKMIGGCISWDVASTQHLPYLIKKKKISSPCSGAGLPSSYFPRKLSGILHSLFLSKSVTESPDEQ